ncbi:endonuclease V [Natronomonas sp. LN261]|jgi:deoxyribonuclease V|uniref:endonuclease V n=1 Tax=Natronomonas sp. LN261 TaxID=2750669 RepID=UPI0015EF307D|nr:endonuclease V [Natronomonas sp. LN261]
MEVAVERFRPGRPDSHEAMEALQAEIASAAVFEDTVEDTPSDVRSGEALVAGIDQAFLDDRAVSAVVVLRGGEVIARESAVTPLSMPYVPGLLAFREGEPIVAALEALDVEPDLLVFDGSGRIHYREAGIATHVGVCFDVPAIGVAKGLLCGRPRAPTDSLEAGEYVPIEADDSMTAPEGTVIGYAYQSRQYPDSTRINPLYISPGHRLSARTALECVIACGGEYKLPPPTRLADRYADELKADV